MHNGALKVHGDTPLKIYSLMLVKNEADIVTSTLSSAADWSDKVIVIDNGSEDGTWEIVRGLAEKRYNVVPFARYEGPFNIGLRSIAYNYFRHELGPRDWWCVRLDADEFFHEDPRAFLAAVPFRYKQVWKKSVDFCFSDPGELAEAGNFESNKAQYTRYKREWWSEIRFARNTKSMFWHTMMFQPKPLGLLYPKRITVLHYQYRSVEQLQKRLETRKKAIHQGCGSFVKEYPVVSWESYAVPEPLLFDLGEGEFRCRSIVPKRGVKVQLKEAIKYVCTMLGFFR
jgi:glycosyltransferase involved in cell wall biosynthesis